MIYYCFHHKVKFTENDRVTIEGEEIEEMAGKVQFFLVMAAGRVWDLVMSRENREKYMHQKPTRRPTPNQQFKMLGQLLYYSIDS